MNAGRDLQDIEQMGCTALARVKRRVHAWGRRDVATLLLLAVGGPLGCTSSSDSDDPGVTTPDAGTPAPTVTPMPSSEAEAMPTADDDVMFSPDGTVDVPEPAAPATDPAVPPGYEGPTVENPIVACDEATAAGDDPLIDDFEGLGVELRPVDGRDGTWYWYDDGTTTATQEVTWAQDVPAVSGTATLHAAGGPFPQYSGVGFGPRWTVLGPEFCSYDASVYDGFTFWARGTGSVRVGLQTTVVRPLALGGQCAEDATCFDSYGMDFTVDDEWTQYWVSFDDVEQAGWGTPAGGFDPSMLYVIEFQFPPGDSYDMYIDDVAFFSGEPMPVASPDGGMTPLEPVDGGTGEVPDGGFEDGGVDAGVSDLDAGVVVDAG